MSKRRTKPTTIPTGKQTVCVEYLELKEIQKKRDNFNNRQNFDYVSGLNWLCNANSAKSMNLTILIFFQIL